MTYKESEMFYMTILYINREEGCPDDELSELEAVYKPGTVLHEQDGSAHSDLKRLLPLLEEGDCLVLESIASAACNAEEFFSLAQMLRSAGADLVLISEQADTRSKEGSALFAVFASLAELDAPRSEEQPAPQEAKYRGRKPIEIDDAVFDEIVALWKEGKMTARQAMTHLNLKPNTFYRRVKERTDNMNTENLKEAAKALKKEMRDTAREEKERARELKKQVKADAAAIKANAAEKLESEVRLHDVEREIKRSRKDAERAHRDELEQLKKEVQRESEEYKNS